MASFQKRGKSWQYTISYNGKLTRKSGFRTKKEAQVAAAVIEADMQKGILPQLKKTPFADYYERWVKLYKKDISAVTLKRYYDTHRAILSYFGDKSIQDIKRPEYQAFLNDYGETRAKETTRKVHIHSRACVLDAVEEGFALTDFTRKAVIAGHTDVKRPEEKHLDYESSKLLLNTLRQKMQESTSIGYHFLLLALTSGMRFAELAALKRTDFDFQKNMVRVNKSWDERTGEMKPVKSKRSNRIIKMDEHTMKDFADLFDSVPPSISGLVFYSPHGKSKALTNANVNKLLKKLLAELELQPITVHGLRHTHCSVLLYERVSVLYVSERLGHASMDTTTRFYSHVIDELRVEDTQSTIDTFSRMRIV